PSRQSPSRHNTSDKCKSGLRQSKKHPKGHRFTLDEKILALSLYKPSPKAYRLLSQICVLPRKSTLNKLMRNIFLLPGPNEMIFEHLKKRVNKMPEIHKYCTVIFDEMAIAAKTGLKVVSVTCDQGTSNIAAINLLIKETKEKYLRTPEVWSGPDLARLNSVFSKLSDVTYLACSYSDMLGVSFSRILGLTITFNNEEHLCHNCWTRARRGTLPAMTAVQDAPAAEEQPAVEDQPAMEDQPALENQPALDDVTFPLPGYCRAPNTSNACMVYKTAQIILVCEYQTV
ncbi:hypothetical protein SFRURICE_001242, partial [Spodoptera frugiperda]